MWIGTETYAWAAARYDKSQISSLMGMSEGVDGGIIIQCMDIFKTHENHYSRLQGMEYQLLILLSVQKQFIA